MISIFSICHSEQIDINTLGRDSADSLETNSGETNSNTAVTGVNIRCKRGPIH